MANITGTLKRISAKEMEGKYGPTKAYSILLETNDGDEWISVGFKNPSDSISEGDTVILEVEVKGKYKNIKKNTAIMNLSGDKPSEQVKTVESSGPFNAKPAATAPAFDKQRMIVRQNALGHATQLVINCAPDKSKTPEVIINIAKQFEAYAMGDNE